jgi:uncharacterized protein
MTEPTAAPLAVVTGASSGIGYELAAEFARNGFDLLIVSEDPRIGEAARSLRDHGQLVNDVQADLATYEGVEVLVSHIQGTGRPVEALAVNAGVGVGGDFTETDLRAELNLIHLNVVSAVHLTKRVLPTMVARGRGRILYTSSIAATMPGPFEAVYAASKAFLYSFAEAIRNEQSGTGVTVTALLPGPTETAFFERAGMQDTKVGTGHKDDPAKVAKQGFEALMAGDDHVVAGSAKNKAMAMASKVTPEKTKAEMHGRISEPGSGESE